MRTRHALRSFLASAGLLSLVAPLATGLAASEPSPGALPRSSPEAQGIASGAILRFVEEADRRLDSLHGLVLVRHGRVVAEGWWTPYGPESPHELYSLSKSFASTAVGLAAAEGKLTIDDPVLSFFPDDAPADPSPNLRAMRIRDLLAMSTGHDKEPPIAPDQVSARSFLAQPVAFKPGTHFLYNTAATFMLSAIVQKTTGQTLAEYLGPRLFEPLGMGRPTWQASFQGISLGGYGLSVRTEDIARFGQLYLREGRWDGRQVLPAEWVAAATARQTSNGSDPASDWDQGYGYQFWRCRHGAYRGDGAFGQYCIVMPAEDAVLAIDAGLGDMQAPLDLVWDVLLPAMGPGPLPEDPAARRRLEERLASLVLRLPAGSASSPLLAGIAGKRFAFPENETKLEAIALEAAEGGGVAMALRIGGEDRRLLCGSRRWEKGSLPPSLGVRLGLGPATGPGPDRPVAASYAWEPEDTFRARLCFYETPFCLDLTLRISADRVVLDSQLNVGFGPTRQPRLEGRLP